MSKEKPEVGDVWLSGGNFGGSGTKCYISAVALTENLDVSHLLYLNGNKQIIGNWHDNNFIVNNMKFLGKSKASLSHLFEVQDDYRGGA